MPPRKKTKTNTLYAANAAREAAVRETVNLNTLMHMPLDILLEVCPMVVKVYESTDFLSLRSSTI